MKIESIKITAEEGGAVGLKESPPVSKLGQVVLVAGKNGSGKTRFFNYLQGQLDQFFRLQDSRIDLQLLAQSVSQYEQRIVDAKRQKANLSAHKEEMTLSLFEQQMARLDSEITNHYREISALQQQGRILTNCQVTGRGGIIAYVPKSLDLQDPYLLTKQGLIQSAQSVFQNGVASLAAGSLPAIQSIQNTYFEATHPLSNLTPNAKTRAEANYKRLENYVKAFLNTELSRDKEGDVNIFGLPIRSAKLSDGQKVLLQFCVALHAQEASLTDLVLLLDEPENHLHPAALNEVLDKLRSVVTNGQIWIATHSINVLAHFQEETLLYMEDGAISFAGNDTLRVLEGLLGDEEERERMARFLSLPFVMSGMRFASESLLDAPVVMTGAADPQMRQIRAALAQERAAGTGTGRLKVLDFGAGKGRLIATLHELAAAEPTPEPLADWLDYVAYDPFPTNAAECRDNIARAYGTADRRYYTDLKPLREQQADGTFDRVILTNVFHEIPPEKWPETLKRSIHQLLKPTGQLIIVEDQRLPHGEHAHQYGFLLFDTLEFEKLFVIGAADKQAGKYRFNEEQEGRLKAHHFTPDLLLRVDTDSRRAALTELMQNARGQIEQVRGRKPTSANGRLHAFWLHQFANAQLALEALG